MHRRAAFQLAALLAVTGFAVVAAHADSNPPPPASVAHDDQIPSCPTGSTPVVLLDEIRHGSVVYHAFPQKPGGDLWGQAAGKRVSFCLTGSGGTWTITAQTLGGRLMTSATVHSGLPEILRLRGQKGDSRWIFSEAHG